MDEGTPVRRTHPDSERDQPLDGESLKQQEMVDRTKSSGIQLVSYGPESEDEGEEDYYANDEFVYEDADVDQSSQDPETKFIKELIENEKNN